VRFESLSFYDQNGVNRLTIPSVAYGTGQAALLRELKSRVPDGVELDTSLFKTDKRPVIALWVVVLLLSVLAFIESFGR
jgi:hypothetical protein